MTALRKPLRKPLKGTVRTSKVSNFRMNATRRAKFYEIEIPSEFLISPPLSLSSLFLSVPLSVLASINFSRDTTEAKRWSLARANENRYADTAREALNNVWIIKRIIINAHRAGAFNKITRDWFDLLQALKGTAASPQRRSLWIFICPDKDVSKRVSNNMFLIQF